MMRDLNNPDSHDGSRFEWSVGGPYAVVIRVKGREVFREPLSKDDRLSIHFEPQGDTDD